MFHDHHARVAGDSNKKLQCSPCRVELHGKGPQAELAGFDIDDQEIATFARAARPSAHRSLVVGLREEFATRPDRHIQLRLGHVDPHKHTLLLHLRLHSDRPSPTLRNLSWPAAASCDCSDFRSALLRARRFLLPHGLLRPRDSRSAAPLFGPILRCAFQDTRDSNSRYRLMNFLTTSSCTVFGTARRKRRTSSKWGSLTAWSPRNFSLSRHSVRTRENGLLISP